MFNGNIKGPDLDLDLDSYGDEWPEDDDYPPDVELRDQS